MSKCCRTSKKCESRPEGYAQSGEASSPESKKSTGRNGKETKKAVLSLLKQALTEEVESSFVSWTPGLHLQESLIVWARVVQNKVMLR